MAAGATLDDTMMAVGYEPSWDHEEHHDARELPSIASWRATQARVLANLALVDSIVAETRMTAEVEPRAPGRCCVVLRAESPQSA